MTVSSIDPRNRSEQTASAANIAPSAAGRPLVVRLSIAHPPRGLELYTPTESWQWQETRIQLNPPAGDPCDFWIIHSYGGPNEQAMVAPCNTLFINGEPPAKKKYPRAFYRQFHHVVDTRLEIGHERTQVFAPCIGWFVGLDFKNSGFKFGYHHLKNLQYPAKDDLISVVCSTTAKTPGQRQRLAFLAALKARLGSRVVHYGNGIRPVADKMEAIEPYRYHLVLENSISPHYWTEKLADAYLGWAFPIYSGCPNLPDYFPSDSFLPINIRDAAGAIRTIENLLSQEPHVPLGALAEARHRILDHYNPFARYHHLAQNLYVPSAPELVALHHYKSFRGWRGWLRQFPALRAA